MCVCANKITDKPALPTEIQSIFSILYYIVVDVDGDLRLPADAPDTRKRPVEQLCSAIVNMPEMR